MDCWIRYIIIISQELCAYNLSYVTDYFMAIAKGCIPIIPSKAHDTWLRSQYTFPSLEGKYLDKQSNYCPPAANI